MKKLISILKAWVMFPVYIRKLSDIRIDGYLNELKNSERNRDKKRLLAYGFQAHAQFDEDGILEEIFKRIGTTNRHFVEFGAGAGHISNTFYLLLQNWSGLWMEGSKLKYENILTVHKEFIKKTSLRVANSVITAENIESLFSENSVPREFDLLSIDIDGNDYHIWNAITSFSPRVVVIEYNAKLNATIEWVQQYNPSHMWSGSSHFGASLKSLELLGSRKGYSLVGCNITGVNAFFVRNDLLGDKFRDPFTSENHFEAPRYFLGRTVGHPTGF